MKPEPGDAPFALVIDMHMTGKAKQTAICVFMHN